MLTHLLAHRYQFCTKLSQFGNGIVLVILHEFAARALFSFVSAGALHLDFLLDCDERIDKQWCAFARRFLWQHVKINAILLYGVAIKKTDKKLADLRHSSIG